MKVTRADLLAKLRASDAPMLTPAQVAPVLGCNPQDIRVAARQAPELLGFPVIVAGRRVKIPRRPFVRFMREGRREDSTL